MSIAQQIADDHEMTTASTATARGVVHHSRKCTCGLGLPWRDWEDIHRLHLSEAAIQAGREQAAADIEAWAARDQGELVNPTDLAVRAMIGEGAVRAAKVARDGFTPANEEPQ